MLDCCSLRAAVYIRQHAAAKQIKLRCYIEHNVRHRDEKIGYVGIAYVRSQHTVLVSRTQENICALAAKEHTFLSIRQPNIN